MLEIEDFTSLPRGFVVPLEGRVDECPQCGRNGIEENPQCSRPYFVHRQSSDVQSDGMRLEPFDRCILTEN